MNTLQTIYNKLQDKTELAKHEVELTAISDLQAIFKKAQEEIQEANTLSVQLGDAVTMWNKTFSKLKTNIKNSEDGVIEGYKLISTIFRQAKDLGIDKVPEVEKIQGYLNGLSKTAMALRGVINDNKNRIDTLIK
jgi:hypothetical protein